MEKMGEEATSTPEIEQKFVFELLTGDILARPVFARDGHVLLDAGAYLTTDLISRIETWGVDTVFVKKTADSAGLLEETGNQEIVLLSEEEAKEPFLLSLGTLEPEEPIEWEEISKAEPPPSEEKMEVLEEEIEKRQPQRKPVERTLAAPPPIVYNRREFREAKRVLHEVHRQVVNESRIAISNLARRKETNVMALRRLIVRLVDDGLANHNVLGALANLTRFDDQLLSHTVSTTVYSILVGYMLGMKREELFELAESALLHDIGMSRISPDVWKKQGRLTDDELLEIQKHTIFGADLLHNIPGITFVSEIVAYQHHERYDGSGYPKGRRGIAINEYARIVGLVDVYAAMTAPRPWRERLLSYEVMKHILASSSSLFDPLVVKAFLRCMSLYPVGSLVELTNGSKGVVVAANPLYPYRPQVKITQETSGKVAGSDGDVVNLCEEPSISILRAIRDENVSNDAIWRAI